VDLPVSCLPSAGQGQPGQGQGQQALGQPNQGQDQQGLGQQALQGQSKSDCNMTAAAPEQNDPNPPSTRPPRRDM
jgi:hypothetical protein